MTELRFRRCDEEDDDELLGLHNRCFQPPWTRAWWRWRYRQLPRERIEILGGFDPDGCCVCMYAGVLMPMHLPRDGRDPNARILCQSDVCIDAERVSGLSGGRLTTEITRRFFADHCQDAALVFGFPVEPLRRIVLRFTKSRVLCDVVLIAHDLHVRRNRQESDAVVREVERFTPEVDGLWASLAQPLGVAIVRDAAYLNWRYADHPLPYTLLEARDGSSGRLRGVAVLRDGGVDPTHASVMDWLVPEDDPDAEEALVEHALAFARALGRSLLVAWFSSAGSHFRRFQTHYGFFAGATSMQQLMFDRQGIGRDWLHSRWYQTLGDIDSI